LCTIKLDKKRNFPQTLWGNSILKPVGRSLASSATNWERNTLHSVVHPLYFPTSHLPFPFPHRGCSGGPFSPSIWRIPFATKTTKIKTKWKIHIPPGEPNSHCHRYQNLLLWPHPAPL
jgi:hypothetical protein